ncbi:hypothetical protein [Dyadobacter fermentans]|uniref:Uncharacterized protein n=1 Tax=Dyadobacter fermentans (strain ATCC 700827 / DSM 18053 / CIP 107007 / KCTC 52180 / NS114) TaxID=471854 RepID=C6W165_DYAFD|nr:hypothetical protein [Dyadobacter fermentans]ACT91922.1 hypothetical protein Dfer_0660 [Dyadobacter fermentans DSM 18053]
MKSTDLITNILGDDRSGLVKGLDSNSGIDDVKKVEAGSECYESDTPLHNIQCYHLLLNDKSFSYKYVYYFDDSDQKIAEINLLLEYDNELDDNISFEAFEELISGLKSYFTTKYGVSKTETEKSGDHVDQFTYFQVSSVTPAIEVVFTEYTGDEEESNIEKNIKVIWQKKL